MGKDYCAIKGCHNCSGQIGRFGKCVKLHHLPKNKALRSAWIRAISRKNYVVTRYTQVCSDHFPNGDGRTWNQTVPTLHLPQKEQTPQKMRHTKNSNRPVQKVEVAATLTSSDEATTSDLPVLTAGFHSYARGPCGNDTEPQDIHQINNVKDKSTQAAPDQQDSCVQTIRPEITIEDIKDSDEKICFYTGLTNFNTFTALFDSLVAHGADKLNVDDDCLLENNLTSKRKLRLVDEFLMVMMRLRLGLLLCDLEYRFKISSGRISRIFSTWIRFMHKCLDNIVFLPPLHVLQQKIPECFKLYPDTRIVLDCTEIFIQTPSALDNKAKTYSHYKSHNTFKALVGINMTGAVVFVSKLWGGSASDVEITRQSGLLDMLTAGDAVMADKGFANLSVDLKKKNVKLYCPPFLSSSSQFSKSEIESTRRIASARIHVERKMEQIKNFRILQGVLPISLSNMADSIFSVCCSLTNLLPALVR